MKSLGSTQGGRPILPFLRDAEETGIPGVEVKFVEIGRNTSGEGALLDSQTDAETRKRGEQTGLDTLVVHAVNDEC